MLTETKPTEKMGILRVAFVTHLRQELVGPKDCKPNVLKCNKRSFTITYT